MPAPPRVLRHPGRPALVEDAAAALVARLGEIQAEGRVPQLALSGDPLGFHVLTAAVARLADSDVDQSRLSLWWTDDAFVPTDHPERHSLRALSLIGGSLHLDPAHIHPIPSSDTYADPEAAAQQYLQELGPTTIDICLLELGLMGQVAGLFPGFTPGPGDDVLGVTDAPCPPAARVSVGLPVINACREVWIFAAGGELAGLVAASFAGAPSLPTSRIGGRDRTWWYLDAAAAALLPFHTCTL
ncbi:MAG: 6-phosphogluconolactonase [Propionibacteriaceae bacterium]|jgi:6-phosphogluconolactonase|nr:6-phosphogluconolactonase [Propionibacteriaceae bacterium]